MFVELISHYGSDEMVVNVARVSFNKIASNYTTEQNIKLINYLAKHNHTSPFRHPHLQFRIQCPIYVERQLFKHQVGWSANSISGRYVDFSDNYTRVDIWRKQSDSAKQGSIGEIDNQISANYIQDEIIELCHQAYQNLLALGVCKEQARTILPMCLNTQFIWTGSLQAFIHLCKLRIKNDVQQETRFVVEQMLNKVSEIPGQPFKHSLEAFGF